MNSHTLNSDDRIAIAAMAKHVARKNVARKNDVSYYLKGVTLEFTACGVLALATDGYIMAIARLRNHADSNATPVGTQITISADMAIALKPKGKNDYLPAVLSFDLQKGPRSIRCGNVVTEIPAECASWAFPDWRHAVPTVVTGEPAQYNPELVMRIRNVAQAMGAGSDYGYLRSNGVGCGCITFATVNLYACIMPLSNDVGYSKTVRPAWVLDDAGEAAMAAVDALAGAAA